MGSLGRSGLSRFVVIVSKSGPYTGRTGYPRAAITVPPSRMAKLELCWPDSSGQAFFHGVRRAGGLRRAVAKQAGKGVFATGRGRQGYGAAGADTFDYKSQR